MRSHSFLMLFAALALCACSTTPAVTPDDVTAAGESATTAVDAVTAEAIEVLVYEPSSGSEVGDSVVYRLVGDSAEELLRVRGVRAYAADDGSVWTVQTPKTMVPTIPCDFGDAKSDPVVGNTTTTKAVFTSLGSGDAITVLQGPTPPSGETAEPVETFEYGIDSIRKLGDFVFVYATEYHECGAHPSASMDASIVSLSTGKQVALGDFMSSIEGLDDERAAAVAGLSPEVVELEAKTAESMEPTIFSVELVDGAPKLFVQMTTSVPYAIHDDSWDSYSISTTVPVDGAPGRLAPAVDVPAPLAAFFAARGAYFEHTVLPGDAAARAKVLEGLGGLQKGM